MKRFFLFDGDNLLYRFAHVSGRQKKTGGTPLFDEVCARMFLAAIREHLFQYSADAAVVVWDGGRSARRMELFPEYKKERAEGHRTEKLRMIARLSPVLQRLSARLLCIPDREADDLIAALARQVQCSVVVTSDRDLLQLVSAQVSVYLFDTKQFISSAFFESNFGVTPEEWLWVRVLSGDTSDSIPGIRGFGRKTAQRLLERVGRFHSVEQLRRKLVRHPKLYAVEKHLLESLDQVSRNLELVDLTREALSEKDVDRVRATILREPVFDPAVEPTIRSFGVRIIPTPDGFDQWALPFRRLT